MFGLVATKRSVDAVSGYSRVSKVYLKVQKRKVANNDERIQTKNLTKFVIITIPVHVLGKVLQFYELLMLLLKISLTEASVHMLVPSQDAWVSAWRPHTNLYKFR